MEGMGLKFTPVIRRSLLRHSSMLGLWLAPLGLIASRNSPNGGFNPALASLPPPPPIPPPTCQPSIICHQ